MQLSDFTYNLPKELIAQEPSIRRDHSNLLVVNNLSLIKTKFFNIMQFIRPNDLIVFNNSKVLKTRLLLVKNEKKVELYFTSHTSKEQNVWQCFAKPSKRLQEGDIFEFDEHKIIVLKKFPLGSINIKIELYNINIFAFLERYGLMPLPPYIKNSNPSLDEDRYQTVYSKYHGSAAAPTAGFHFTNELLEEIKSRKIETSFITLHIGSGTFLPIRTENLNDHKMHSEHFHISEESANVINKAKTEGRRIIAVGTTSLRALESACIDGIIKAGNFETDLFVKPGFKFQVVDTLITNFHLPKSTLFVLVCAFAGKDKIFDAYNYAINEKMRFFSYGDAMLVDKGFV